MLGIALLLAVVTAGTKIATGRYAAGRAGIRPAGRWRTGGTLVARGEFSIVIAGLAVGVEPRLGPLATAYVLILVVLGPLAARYTEPAATSLTALATRLRKPRTPSPESPSAAEAPSTTPSPAGTAASHTADTPSPQ